MKIGIFDSGIGGITVLSELRRRYPALDYLYLGDTANVPYGSKSPAQIHRLSAQCAKILKSEGVDLLVVACNTASSLALDTIREIMGDTHVYGVVEPGVQAALRARANYDVPVLVLATRATIKSGSYRAALLRSGMKGEIIEQACPLLVPMIEEGWVDHPILQSTIEEYVAPYRSSGVALLGCTHYPWVFSAFQKALPEWIVVNSAEAIVHSLENDPVFQAGSKNASGRKGSLNWIFTDPESVADFALKRA